MDSYLTYNDHICEKISTANKMLGIISRNLKDLDKSSFILLYKCMIRSHLEYADSVWSPYKISQIRNVEKVQKRGNQNVKIVQISIVQRKINTLESSYFKI